MKTKNFILSLMLLSNLAYSQSSEELAKKLSNPVSSLISVPLQNSVDFSVGDNNGTKYTLNIQPVIPVKLNSKFNLIVRTILPVISLNNIVGATNIESGISDLTTSAFISPTESKNGLVWGAGTVMLAPTGSNDFLTTKKWGAGPSAILLKQSNAITYGALVNHIWSFAGDSTRKDVNQSYFNPFFTYNWKTGSGFSSVIDWTQNWEDSNSNVWASLLFSTIGQFGKQKMQFAIGPRYNISAPRQEKADLGLRATVILLFAK